MAWIAFNFETPEKAQTLELVQILGLPRPHILGALALTWRWFSEQTVLGLSHTCPGTVSTISETPGFGEALVRVGWLRVLPDGAGIEMPNFDRHTGSAHAARRKASWRWQTRPKTVPGQSQDSPAVVLTQNQSQSQSQKEEEPLTPFSITRTKPQTKPRKKPPIRKPEDVPIPATLRAASPALQDWIEHRRALGKPATAVALQRLLLRLEAWGPERAVQALEHSLEHNWSGVFEPKSDEAGGTPTIPGLRQEETAAQYANRRAAERAARNGSHPTQTTP